jgi:hypothetical protein
MARLGILDRQRLAQIVLCHDNGHVLRNFWTKVKCSRIATGQLMNVITVEGKERGPLVGWRHVQWDMLLFFDSRSHRPEIHPVSLSRIHIRGGSLFV